MFLIDIKNKQAKVWVPLLISTFKYKKNKSPSFMHFP